MLFMGEEWAAPEPFPFFCDFSGDMADQVREGRRREFAHLPEFADPELRERIPDPTAESTFRRAVLNWECRDRPVHRERLDLYRRLLDLRQREVAPRLFGMCEGGCTVELAEERLCRLRWRLADGAELSLAANLGAESAFASKREVHGRLLHETHPGLARLLGEAGRMPPWSVLWTIADPGR
jgi:1,4-alpha-glucan branching enzyme